MIKKISMVAEVAVTLLTVGVTSAADGAGEAVPYQLASSRVTITNISNGGGLQYKINSGIWLQLAPSDGISVAINMESDQLFLRRATIGGGLVTADLSIEGVPAIAAGGSPLPAIFVSSIAPNNNDGRPDGTVYIQSAS